MRTRLERGRGTPRVYADFRDRNVWPCVYCEHVSKTEGESARHRRTHPLEERVATCGECGQTFVNVGYAYIAHLKSHQSAEERFWEKVAKTAGDGCWLWVGCRDRKGYGRFGFEQKVWFAHRWLWEQTSGPVPDDCELDHLCCNQACVRPDHLEAVPHLENMRRAHRKQRVNCPHCGKSFMGRALAPHIRRKHASRYQVVDGPKGEG